MPSRRSGRSAGPSSPTATSGLADSRRTQSSTSGHGSACEVDGLVEIARRRVPHGRQVGAHVGQAGRSHGQRRAEEHGFVGLAAERAEPLGHVDVGGGEHAGKR